jgi:hypothetical protein
VTARSSSAWTLIASSRRPGQWSNNFLLFAALIFGGRLLDPHAIAAAMPAFVIAVVTASTVTAYAVYAVSAETAAPRNGTAGADDPFVLYGIFRYLYLVHQKRGGGSPAALLMAEGPLLACVGLWVATVAVLVYAPPGT